MTKQTEALKLIQEHIDMQQYQHAWDKCQELIEQPAQEPVSDHEQYMTEARKAFGIAPSWQGLSDDELDALNGSPMALEHSSLYKFARAIEQALKEKNT